MPAVLPLPHAPGDGGGDGGPLGGAGVQKGTTYPAGGTQAGKRKRAKGHGGMATPGEARGGSALWKQSEKG